MFVDWRCSPLPVTETSDNSQQGHPIFVSKTTATVETNVCTQGDTWVYDLARTRHNKLGKYPFCTMVQEMLIIGMGIQDKYTKP